MNEPRARHAGWTTPVVIFALAAAVYALLGSLQAVPVIAPDEFVYGHLARSLADGDGLSFYGADQSLPMRLYVYLIAPGWILASGESAYTLAKIIGTLAACTVVFPVWVLARRIMPPARAAIPVVLTVAGTWMLSTAGLVTENLAFPLGTAALACAVLALREPESRWLWAALAFAVAAAASRAQMAVLFPVILAAVLVSVALADDRRAQLQHYRVQTAILGLIALTGLVILLAGSASLLGPYADVSDFAPPLGRALSKSGEQWLALTIMCGALPMAALIALAAQRSAWRDPDLGPLLWVTVPAVLVLVLQTGFFNAGVGSDGLAWSIERYVVYAVPLMLVLLFAGLERGRLPVVWLGGVGLGIAFTLLAAPEIRLAVEERAQFAVSDLLGTEPWVALTLMTLVVVGIAVAVIARLPGARAVYAMGGLLLVVLLAQSQGIWRWQIDLTDQVRAEYPASLSWVDDNAKGPVSRIYAFQNSALFQSADLFNSEIEQVLRPSLQVPGRDPLGPACRWAIDPRGVMTLEPGCDPVRRRIWNDDPIVTMSFHGGRVLARDAFLGQLIAVPEKPRLRSIIRNPCQRATLTLGRDGSPTGIPKDVKCTPHMSINLWLDAPGTLELTFAGGANVQSVRRGTRSWRLPPRVRTRLRIPVSSAVASIPLMLDWDRSARTPRLVEAVFASGSVRESLL